jgi:ribosomal protein S18 acetylase RimI-like enzyme
MVVVTEEIMEIRVLTASDASAYWKIRLESLERDPEAFTASAEEHHALTVEDVAARLVPADPVNNFVVGAFAGERLIGTAGFYRDKGLKTRHKGHIWGVYVTQEARGKGVAREMMRAVLERAVRLEGLEQIMLGVGTARATASKLYRSLGFESYGCERRALKIGDLYVDEEYMTLFVKRQSA